VLIDRGSVFDPFLNPIPNLDKNRAEVGMVIGACLWIPKPLWQKLGGFPESFHTLAEDMFICCYARLCGYPVEVLTVSGFRHWLGKNLGGGKIVNNRLRTTVLRRALSERNKTFTMILCYPVLVMLVVLPLHLMLLIIEGFLLSLIKRDFRVWREIYWNCLRGIWAHRKILKQTRNRIQQERKVTMCAFFKPYTLFPHKLRMLWRHGLPEVR
jgi:GT2 family glycosyltransferase